MKTQTAPTSSARRGAPRRTVQFVGLIAGVVVVVAAFFAWGAMEGLREHKAAAPEAVAPNVPPQWQRTPVTAKGLEQKIGVKIVQVAVTGEGGLLDVRFQVVDPNLAAAIHDQSNPPALVDETTGVVANSLLMGHSHSSPFNVGVTYYLIFENPGNLISRGDTVSVLLGDAQVEHVQVQ